MLLLLHQQLPPQHPAGHRLCSALRKQLPWQRACVWGFTLTCHSLTHCWGGVGKAPQPLSERCSLYFLLIRGLLALSQLFLMDFAFSLRLFFFAGVAKVNSHGWLFGKQGREERDIESGLVQMCPDKHCTSADMCWGPSAARVKISGKRSPFVERQAQQIQLQGLLLDQRCHA